MKKPVLAGLALLSFLLIITACASEPEPTSVPSKQESAGPTVHPMIKLINEIEKAPAAPDVDEKYKTVAKFAVESPEVSVVLDQKLMKWLSQINHSKWGPYLLGAFMAGNVRKQLIDGKKKDSTYEGLAFVVHTYAAIKRLDRGFANAELEQFAKLEKAGLLQSYVLQIKKGAR